MRSLLVDDCVRPCAHMLFFTAHFPPESFLTNRPEDYKISAEIRKENFISCIYIPIGRNQEIHEEMNRRNLTEEDWHNENCWRFT